MKVLHARLRALESARSYPGESMSVLMIDLKHGQTTPTPEQLRAIQEAVAIGRHCWVFNALDGMEWASCGPRFSPPIPWSQS